MNDSPNGATVLRKDAASFMTQVDFLLAALGDHDRATRCHSDGVAAWSRQIAKRLGHSPATVTFIERCALMHDIGKLSTPKAILLKAGPLSAREWTIMRTHAADGAAMLDAIPGFAPYARVIRAHHERCDGAGYPFGLREEAIPFEARIISVADAFDAMVGNRSYRRPLAPKAALEELQRCSGAQFEAAVVDSLISILEPRRVRRDQKFATYG